MITHENQPLGGLSGLADHRAEAAAGAEPRPLRELLFGLAKQRGDLREVIRGSRSDAGSAIPILRR